MQGKYFNFVVFLILQIVFIDMAFTQGTRLEEAKDRNGKKVYLEINNKRNMVDKIVSFSENIRNYGFSNDQLNKETVEAMTRKLVDDYSPLLKLNSKDMNTRLINSSEASWSIEYTQMFNGIKVEGSYIGMFFIKAKGDIEMGMKTFSVPSTQTTKPTIDAKRALQIAKMDHSKNTILKGRGDPELVIYPEEKDSFYIYHLAWKFGISFIYYIDAVDGTILEERKNWQE